MSSNKNKKMRRKLENIYGKGCFFERARIAERIEAMGGIKTFKVFKEEKRFKGKAISYQITLHHLRHVSNGGQTTEENCANVAQIAHEYIHSLPHQNEEMINDMLREFKINCLAMRGDGEMVAAQQISFKESDFEDAIVIPVYDNTPEIQEKRKKNAKYNRLKNPTRAMRKQELQQLIDEEEWDR